MIFLLLSNKIIVLAEKSSARLTVLFSGFCDKWSAFIIVGKNSRILAPEEILLLRAERQC